MRIHVFLDVREHQLGCMAKRQRLRAASHATKMTVALKTTAEWGHSPSAHFHVGMTLDGARSIYGMAGAEAMDFRSPTQRHPGFMDSA